MRVLTLGMGLIISSQSYSQNGTSFTRLDPNKQTAKPNSIHLEKTKSRITTLPIVVNPSAKPEAILWSEDFASGFTGGVNGNWIVGGVNSNFVEYDTDGPDSLISNPALGWGPLPSPTAANGFVNFDFFLKVPDITGAGGTGPAEGTLTSPVINLGTNANVELVFYQMIMHCCNFEWNASIDISTDGGLSFPNSINVTEDFGRNDQHWNLGYGYEFRYKLKDYIQADPSNVVLRFNWTSTTADANGQFSNSYFWMLDDIVIRDVPENSLEFTVASDGAPAHDAIFDNDGRNTRTGIMPLYQKSTLTFDANVLNYGLNQQSGVKLLVDIYDDQGNPLANLTSAANNVIINENDTATYDSLFTSLAWDPPAVGAYDIVYTVTCDSINVPGFEIPIDTFRLFITDSLQSVDWNSFDNNIGTEDLGNDGSAMLVRYPIKNPNSDTTDRVFIESVDIRFSTRTVAGGEVLIEVYDTTGGVDPANGPSGSPIYSQSFPVTATMVGSTGIFELKDSVFNDWTKKYDLFPLPLESGKSYFFVVHLFSNNGTSRIQIANDQSFPQQRLSRLMFNSDQGTWFAGFEGNLDFNSPWIRVRYGATPHDVGLDDELKTFDFEVYPNPTSTGKLNVELNEIGSYDIELISTTGHTVKTLNIEMNNNTLELHTIDVSDLAKGIYILNIVNNKSTQSVKVNIQ